MARWAAVVAIVLHVVGLAAVASAAERVVDLETRPGVTLRFLLREPATPAGSLILLAGGHGRLDLGADGRPGWGAGNQLVRTRGAYAEAGFVVAVPDVPSDMKSADGSVASGYRWSAEHAHDMGRLTAYLRRLASPVFIAGTSRGSLSAASAVARLAADRPDGLVLTAGMLLAQPRGKQPSIERTVDLTRIDVPTLLVHHARDGCPSTPAADVEPFRKRLTRAPRVDVVILDGGRSHGDPCEARAHHGFEGLDAEVVAAVVGWMRARAR